jgi:hypothetical protein
MSLTRHLARIATVAALLAAGGLVVVVSALRSFTNYHG